MKKQRLNIITLTIAFFMLAQPINAEEHIDSMEAHMHGLSELTIAMENQALEIQLTSPAMNLIGFEHEAHTQKEIAAVKDVEAQLNNYKTHFAFSGANCSHIETSIDVTSLIDNNNHTHPTEHEDHAEKDRHSEIIANYQLVCENKPSLLSITVDLFDAFPGIHEIQVMWVIQEQQGAITLTANKRKIKFR